MKTFYWCGFSWKCCMEGNSVIHPVQPWMWYDEDMVSIDEYDDVLELNACVKPKEITTWDGKTFNPTYAVGLLRSTTNFHYGHYSCEIQLPDGNNCWPAFWLVGSGMPWPKGGELDIMEAWQNSSSYFRLNTPYAPYVVPSWWATNNLHYQNGAGKHAEYGSRGIPLCKMLRNPEKRFVKYECEWLPDKVTFYANGKKTREINDIPALSPNLRVVFDLWGQEKSFKVTQPMKCKNFKYEPLV